MTRAIGRLLSQPSSLPRAVPETLTVVCDLGLQPRELVDAALGGARYELRPQLVAVDCPRLSVPIHSHVYQSTCEGGCGVLAGLRVGVDIAK